MALMLLEFVYYSVIRMGIQSHYKLRSFPRFLLIEEGFMSEKLRKRVIYDQLDRDCDLNVDGGVAFEE